MKQFAFIGLGPFALSMLERVSEVTDQIVVLDDSTSRIEHIKELVSTAYSINLRDSESFERILHEPVDVAIVDIAGPGELSLLAVHRLKKLGVPQIIVNSSSEEYDELLQLLGADRVVNADREAAMRIAPLVLSSSLTNFMPISGDLVLAEVIVPEGLMGKTVVEADLRRVRRVNVVAVKFGSELEAQGDRAVFHDLDIHYQFKPGDVILVTGRESDVFRFAGIAQSIEHEHIRPTVSRFFKTMFNRRKQHSEKK